MYNNVEVDFERMKQLSQAARREYGLGGAVQHGASTLPESAFPLFVEYKALEIHLATSFTNTLFQHLPPELIAGMYTYLDQKFAHKRKPGMTDAQFYYSVRKFAIGPFKKETWNLTPEKRDELSQAWQLQVENLFRLLGLQGTRALVEEFTPPIHVQPELADYLANQALKENLDDLAD